MGDRAHLRRRADHTSLTNSVSEGVTGFVKSGPSWSSQQATPDFDLDGIFSNLAEYDYDKAVQLARGLTKESPRAIATLAISRKILEEKKK